MHRHDFINSENSGQETYFDIFEDWGLIESSFSMQYGIRLRAEEDMSWDEFCTLLSGLGGDTPLGKVVAIRSESDINVIEHFTPEQRRIRDSYLLKKQEQLKENPEAYKAYIDNLQARCKALFGRR